MALDLEQQAVHLPRIAIVFYDEDTATRTLRGHAGRGWLLVGRRNSPQPHREAAAAVWTGANAAARIWLVDPEAPQPCTLLTEFPAGPRIRGIAWTPDGGSLLIGKHDFTSDIVLMDQGK